MKKEEYKKNMKKIILLLLSIYPLFLVGQSLGAERVQRLRESVVRVLIEDKPAGTAFFISDDILVSCWHVVDPAVIKTGSLSQKNMEIELSSGERIGIDIPLDMITKYRLEALSYDFTILFLKNKPKSKYSFLPLGNFSDINDGDMVYTLGYPLGIKQGIIANGIVSSKFTNTVSIFNATSNDTIYVDVNSAWLDLTMNRGNSGGPILKIGNTPAEDKVIGIATFILNPYMKDAEQLVDFFNNPVGDITIPGGVSLSKVYKLFALAITNNSIGVSGCISINYLLKVLK